MKKIGSPEELIVELRNDLKNKFSRIVFAIGRLVLSYPNITGHSAYLDQWGMCAEYSIKIAFTTAAHCANHSMVNNLKTTVAFAFLVDDITNAGAKAGPAIMNEKNAAHIFYVANALPISYKNRMIAHSFNENNIIRTNHGIKDREGCIFFSQKIFMKSRQLLDKNSYTMIYEKFMNQLRAGSHNFHTTCFVSFVPSEFRLQLSGMMHTTRLNWLNIYLPRDIYGNADDDSQIHLLFERGVYYDYNFPNLA